MKRLLLIFYRNPVIGGVKTRLAKTAGDEKALAVYLFMAAHTRRLTENLLVDKRVYYSDFIDREDAWDNHSFQKFIQAGDDLGERMLNAFREGYRDGYEAISIIGTDCLELTSSILASAFQELNQKDVVLGPAKDGGYYLLGMTRLWPEFFQGKAWSTSSVAKDTIRDCEQLELSYSLLPVLQDVDEEADLPADFTI